MSKLKRQKLGPKAERPYLPYDQPVNAALRKLGDFTAEQLRFVRSFQLNAGLESCIRSMTLDSMAYISELGAPVDVLVDALWHATNVLTARQENGVWSPQAGPACEEGRS